MTATASDANLSSTNCVCWCKADETCNKCDPPECQHEWGNFQEWNDASGLHGSKRCILCGRYVQW